MAAMDSRATDIGASRGLRGATADRTTMARTLAYLFISGAVLAFLAIAIPRVVDVPELGLGGPVISVAITLVAFAFALHLRGRSLLIAWPFQVALALATVLVTALV